MIPAKDVLAVDATIRAFWLAQRRALLMQLGAIEDLLGMPRSVVPKRKRKKEAIIKPEVK